MAGPAISHTYRYAFESKAVATAGGVDLRLATSGSAQESLDFFQGKLTRPTRAADLLRGLVQVVQSRFYTPPAMLGRILALADPVITCSDDVIRFEAFSSCCSTYARVDLLPPAVEGERTGRGTTNVDFNAPLRAALARVRDSDSLGLAIGAESVELSRGIESIVERKVSLPLRWLRGFVEVQAYQARMSRRLEVPGPEALRFLRSLPRGASPGSAWVVPAGRGLRLSQTPARDGVRLGGVGPLRVLESLARHARSLRVYSDESSGASTWELVLDEARFHLVVSPDVSRGFSGEGQVLSSLAAERWENVLPRVRASLQWQTRVDAQALAASFSLNQGEVAAALAALGSRGLVGFDLAERAYFHRELPFDFTLVESLHPRLKDARKLVAASGVRVNHRTDGRIEAFVRGTEVEHRVLITGETATCTCPWYAKHQGARGPCKHVLAVQIVVGDDGSDRGPP
jgi:predicted nucleic acid-binding Zn finger protein